MQCHAQTLPVVVIIVNYQILCKMDYESRDEESSLTDDCETTPCRSRSDRPGMQNGYEEDKCVPLSVISSTNLSTEEVYRIFQQAKSTYKDEMSKVPPVLPREGEIFLLYLGPDKALWDINKRKFR